MAHAPCIPAVFRRLAVLVALTLVATAQAAQAKTFAWKATGKGGTIYLMGSIHVMSESFYPLNPALEAAFKDSDLLVEEVDLAEMLDPMAQMNILTRGMLPSNQSLDKVLSPATLALVKKATGDLGAAGGPLMRFKPWMLAITLQGMELHEGRLRSGARPRSAFLRSGEGRRQERCRGSRRWSSRSRASTR